MSPVEPPRRSCDRPAADPAGRLRGGQDRCPGTLRLHPADDGHLARVRVPGGRLTGQQLAEIASVATDLGDGALHLTSRGNLQVRGLPATAGQALADRLFHAGLLPSVERDRVRNVVASPLAGLDGTGCADVEGVLADLDRLLCETPGLDRLSGRFLFAVDDGRGDMLGAGADLSAVAEPGKGFRLWVGGRASALSAPAAGAARLLVEAAARFLACAEPTGAWRVAELDAPERVAPLGASIAPAATPAPGRPPLGTVTGTGALCAVHVLPPLGSARAAQWAVLASLAGGPSAAPPRI
ncbi:MAG TPA: hypothetical protein VFJ94_14025, partial [Intrasporangium sp.]|uniref:hypothetical protein n=1 Tax=Intrasporangium sp. TaxID=1925024 RepID=UPI002D767E2D